MPVTRWPSLPGYCPKTVGFSCGIQLPIFLGHPAVRADIACADLHPEKPHNSACRLAFDPHRPVRGSLLAERFASASLNFVNGTQTWPLAAMHDLSEWLTDPAHPSVPRATSSQSLCRGGGKRERHGSPTVEFKADERLKLLRQPRYRSPIRSVKCRREMLSPPNPTSSERSAILVGGLRSILLTSVDAMLNSIYRQRRPLVLIGEYRAPALDLNCYCTRRSPPRSPSKQKRLRPYRLSRRAFRPSHR